MKTLLIRCYPAAWRERYGDEFASILDERPLGPFDVADILLGALDARLRMRDRRAGLTERKGFNMSLRIGGIAAILAAVSLASAWFLGYGFVAVEDRFVWLLLVIGLGLLIVAIAGLTAFQGRAYPGASWAAFGLLTTAQREQWIVVRWIVELSVLLHIEARRQPLDASYDVVGVAAQLALP